MPHLAEHLDGRLTRRIHAAGAVGDAQNVLWDFVEVTPSGAPVLTPSSNGSGAPASCTETSPDACTPCKNGGTCGWVQDVFIQ